MESTRERYKIERAVFRSEGWERVVTPCDGGHNRPLCHQGCCWACGEESALCPRPRYRLLRAFAKKKQGPFFVVAMSQTKKIGAGGGSVKPSLFARHIHALHKGMVCVFFSLSPRVHYTMLTEPRAWTIPYVYYWTRGRSRGYQRKQRHSHGQQETISQYRRRGEQHSEKKLSSVLYYFSVLGIFKDFPGQRLPQNKRGPILGKQGQVKTRERSKVLHFFLIIDNIRHKRAYFKVNEITPLLPVNDLIKDHVP